MGSPRSGLARLRPGIIIVPGPFAFVQRRGPSAGRGLAQGETGGGAAVRGCVPTPPAWHATLDSVTHFRPMSYVVAFGLRASVPARIRAGQPFPRPPLHQAPGPF